MDQGKNIPKKKIGHKRTGILENNYRKNETWYIDIYIKKHLAIIHWNCPYLKKFLLKGIK